MLTRTAPPQRHRAFTLVELLVSMLILLMIMLVLVSMVDQTSRTWRYTTSKIEQFRDARLGFEAVTRRLSQATLNTYLDYVDSSGKPRVSSSSTTTTMAAFIPAKFTRLSELRLISGPGLAGSATSTPPRPNHSIFFQAPLGFVSNTASYGGLENLLNTWGYYIEFDRDRNRPPFITDTIKPARYRFRLMEMMQPSESLSLYNYTAGNPGLTSSGTNGKNWFTDPLGISPAPVHVLAENIIALILLPKLSPGDQAAGSYTDGSLAPTYTYDSTLSGSGTTDANLNSRSQLPPIFTVTMVAADEATFNRFQGASTTMPSIGLNTLFQTVGDTKDVSMPGFAQDLQTLQNTLTAKHINYRVFTTNVSLKAAKWSRAQAN